MSRYCVLIHNLFGFWFCLLPVVGLSCLKLRVQHLVNIRIIVSCCLTNLSKIKSTAFVIVAIFQFVKRFSIGALMYHIVFSLGLDGHRVPLLYKVALYNHCIVQSVDCK